MVGDAAEVAGAAVGAPGLDSAVCVVLDGQDVGMHMAQNGADAFVLVLRVVVGLEAFGETALVVAVIQQVVLHHRKGVLGLSCQRQEQNGQNKKGNLTFHF